MASIVFFRLLQRFHERALGALVELLTYIPMVIEDEIVGLLTRRIDQQQGALEVVEELLVGKFRGFFQNPIVEHLGFWFVAFDIKENEIFP